jgi:hypothetical protein
MNRVVQCEAKLRELLVRGALPASACGDALRQLTASLIAGGVLTWQRGGPGQRLVVSDQERFAEFIAATYPLSAGEISDLPSARVSGVGRYRDSKAITNDNGEIISVRAWTDDALRCDGNPIPATTHTTQFGVFSFLLNDCNRHTLHEQCALVENPSVFTAFENLAIPTKIVFLGRGRISERFLNWFRSQTDVGFSLLHLPDYDPVGLDEFERLRKRLGNRVRLHVPDDLSHRFERFGNRDLLSKPNSQTIFARLRRAECPEVLRIVRLIDRYNAGLEQEALLL